MKKWFAALLALLLLCALSSTAWASEMYDTYGPMEDWDEEIWALSEAWSDEQWEDYWQGEEEDYALEWERTRREERLKLGLPDPDGVNVKLNEAFLLFPNNKPQMLEGSLYLPLRDFLAAVGQKAELSFDAATGAISATLADGRTLTAALGQTEIFATTAAGEEYEIYSYNEPQLLDGSIYIPQWALCEFLGLDNSFDYSYEILYLVEPVPLIAQLDGDFTILNRLLQSSARRMDFDTAYKFTGNVALSGTLYGEEKNDAISARLDYSGVVQGLNVEMEFAIKLDVQQMKDSLFSMLDTEAWRILNLVSAGKGRLILNSAEGALYMQSNLLSLADARLGSQDWLKIEYAPEELSLTTDMMWQQLAELSVGRLIYDSARSSGYYYGSRDIYSSALESAKQVQAILGDENFKQERRGGYNVYTLRGDQQQLAENSDFYLPGGGLLGMMFGYGYGSEGDMQLDYQLVFREQEGRLQDLDLAATLKTGGAVPVSYTLQAKCDQLNGQANFEMTGRYGGKLVFSMEQQMAPTDKAPASAPPSGSKIVTEKGLGSSGLYLF